jgi:glycosyltransferase involved in cell wall biosynthesis
VLVYPTRFDPWGIPIIEALACGTPVAASARAGAASEVTPGTSGVRIEDPSDPAVVAAATLDALQLKSERERLRESILHLKWGTIIDRVEQILLRTLR